LSSHILLYNEFFMMDWAKELKKIRVSSGLSQQKWAEIIGIPQKTWSNYENGRTAPKMGVLWALATKGYPVPGLALGAGPPGAVLGYKPSPLVGGEKEDKLRERHKTAMALAKESDPETPVDNAWSERVDSAYTNRERPLNAKPLPIYHPSDLPEGFFVVPLLDQRLSAGPGAALPEADEAGALIPVPGYLRQYGENIAALTVDGDSMEPTLHRGDMVVCDSCGWSGEGIYAVRMGGAGFVKRITKRPGKVVVLSDNPKYPPQEEPEGSEDFAIIGRVHCAITKVE
jgi:phage repressor protein C with HTH and peptisase S24 domain/DNA-binding XRE family transcriptional regulator